MSPEVRFHKSRGEQDRLRKFVAPVARLWLLRVPWTEQVIKFVAKAALFETAHNMGRDRGYEFVVAKFIHILKIPSRGALTQLLSSRLKDEWSQESSTRHMVDCKRKVETPWRT